MGANHRRGEIAAILNGREYRLCLTLGALAELESAFGSEDLTALVERFSTGRLSARDMVTIIGIGLRATGQEVSDDDVRTMRCEDGAAGYARIVADLLAATFGAAGETAPANPPPSPGRR